MLKSLTCKWQKAKFHVLLFLNKHKTHYLSTTQCLPNCFFSLDIWYIGGIEAFVSIFANLKMKGIKLSNYPRKNITVTKE